MVFVCCCSSNHSSPVKKVSKKRKVVIHDDDDAVDADDEFDVASLHDNSDVRNWGSVLCQ